MAETRTDEAARRKVWDLIRDIGFAMMVTLDGQGRLRSRPMSAAHTEEDSATLWFFTPDPSPKAEEIAEDARVLLAYADPSRNNHVSLFGNARMVNAAEKRRELWSEPLRTWFPDGPEDARAALIRVEVESAEYWDAPASGIVYAYGYLKARLIGQAPDPAETGKVAFRA